MIAGGSDDGKIAFWDARSGTRLRTLEEHRGWVASVVFSPDGYTFAAGGAENSIYVWDVRTGEHLATLAGHTASVRSVAFSPRGSTLASGSLDRTIRLWDVSTGEHLQTFEGHTGGIWSVMFSPDGSSLASASDDSTMLSWDLRRMTTWGEIKRLEFVGGARKSLELSSSATPLTPTETALLANYPESVQSGDVDTVSAGDDGGGGVYHLRHERTGGSDTGSGTPAGRRLSEPQTRGVIGTDAINKERWSRMASISAH